MQRSHIEREVLDSGIEVVRTTRTDIQAGIKKRIAVEYRDDKRVTRYSADFFDEDRSMSGEVLIGAQTGTPLVAILARAKLAYGRSIEIAHGGEETVFNNALRMHEVYSDDKFFSGISFTFQRLDQIHLFHVVSGDKSRYKATISLGETVDHPHLYGAFPYQYSAKKEGSDLEFSRIWKPNLSRWSLRIPEGLNHMQVADQIRGIDWIKTKDIIPVSLNID